MKKESSRVIIIFALCLFVFSNSLLASAQQKNSILPSNEHIKEKKHYKNIMKMKNEDEVDSYLEKLSEKELLQTIAEVAEESEGKGNISDMLIFNKHVKKKIVNELEEEDYTDIIKNESYSKLFKAYMIDLYTYTKRNKKEKNSENFNKTLRKIVKDKNGSSNLRFYALSRIDDLNINDKEMINNIINSNRAKGFLKASALRKLMKLDEAECYKKIRDIIKSIDKYSSREVRMALRLIPEISDNIIEGKNDSVNSNKTKVKYFDEILKNSKDEDIIRSSVYALGDIKDKESIKTILKYRNKINDDGRIRYYVNKNYLTVDKMLDNSNDNDTILLALKIIEIAPFEEFTENLEMLANKHKDDKIKNQAKKLIDLIEKESYNRNSKWDEY